MTELEVLTPVAKELVLQNTKVTIRPFKFTQFFMVGKFLQQIRAKIGDINMEVVTDTSGVPVLKIDFIKLIAECGEEMKGLCILSSEKDATFIDSLDADEGIVLLATIFEVNKDFFFQKILPQFDKIIKKIAMERVAGAL